MERSRGADESLEKKVNNYIGGGWKPLGGVCVVKTNTEQNDNYGRYLFAQAMVKE